MRPAAILLAVLLLVPSVIFSASGQSAPDLPSLHDVEWTEGPVDDTGVPVDDGRHLRALLRVDPGAATGAQDVPVTFVFDAEKHLAQAGYPTTAEGNLRPFRLVPESMTLVEVDPSRDLAPTARDQTGAAVRTPLLVVPGGLQDPQPYDAAVHPVVTLQWVMPGPSDGPRYFLLYFDTAHNGPKIPVSFPDEALGRVAASVGPGRGTDLYVALHDRIDGLPNDPRTLRITNTQDTPVQVEVHRYDRFGLPKQASDIVHVPGGMGRTVTYNGLQDYEGNALWLHADGLVTVEAASARTSTTYQPGSSTLFLPGSDGGFVGRSFAQTPAAPAQWFVFCSRGSADPATDTCDVRFQQGSTQQVEINAPGYVPFDVQAGSVARVETTAGSVAVQRVAGGDSETLRSPTLWPPLDGPATSTSFMGHALGGDGTSDQLLLMARQSGPSLFVKDLTGAFETLTDGLEVPTGLYQDEFGDGLGTRWERDWRVSHDPSTSRRHADGPVFIEDATGTGGVTVVNGFVADQDDFSAVVPLQSEDGGLTYRFAVPENTRGVTLGQLVVFTPYPGTTVRVHGTDLDGAGTRVLLPWDALQKGQILQQELRDLGSGWWTIESDRPVVAYWHKEGTQPLATVAAGVTDAASVHVADVQHTGYLFGVEAQNAFETTTAGARVEFRMDIENLARTVDGEGLSDRIRVEARTPPGWDTPRPVVADVGPAGSVPVTLRVKVPDDVGGSTGDTISYTVRSDAVEDLVVEGAMHLSYRVKRGVEVSADGSDVRATRTIKEGETHAYQVTVTNTGTLTDAFSLRHSLPTGDWRVEVVCNSEPTGEESCPTDGEGRTPTLGPGASVSYFVEVGLPPDASSAFRYIMQFLATSQSDPSVADSVALLTTLDQQRSFRAGAEEPTRVVPPGSDVMFNISVVNDADVDEEVEVELQGLLPDGWGPAEATVMLPGLSEPLALDLPGDAIPLPPRQSALLQIHLPVPDQAPPLEMATLRVSLQSTIAGSGQGHALDLRAVVAHVPGFLAEAGPAVLTADPGSMVEVTVRLESRGNFNQTVEVVPKVAASNTPWDFHGTGGKPMDNLTLNVGETREVTLSARVPRDMPPATLHPSNLSIALRVPGLQTDVLEVPLQIGELPAAEPLDEQALVFPGRDTPVPLGLRNTGNVPMHLCVDVEDLPAGWSVTPARTFVAVGREAAATVQILAPHDATPTEASLRITRAGDETSCGETSAKPLLQAPLDLVVGAPRLVAQAVQETALGDGRAVHRVHVRNDGQEPAYEVTVGLRDGQTVHDRVILVQILPGREAVASLVGPATRDVTVHVSARHDPDGFTLDDDASDSVAASDKGIPASGAAAAAALAALLRRRRLP